MEDSTTPFESAVACSATDEEQIPVTKTEEEEEEEEETETAAAAASPIPESPKAQAVNENPEEELVPPSFQTEENSSPPKSSRHTEEENLDLVAEEASVELRKEEVEVPAADPVAVAAELPETPAPAPDVSVTVNGNSNNITEANGAAEDKETTGNTAVAVAEKPQGKREEESMPPEADDVAIQPHWHAKPCLHITSIGGFITEEDISNMFSEFGKISSIVFENERKDAAIIRYEIATAEGEDLVAKAKEKLHNAQLGDRTLRIEEFRSDLLLFIGNLTPDIDDELLRKMFEQHGTIERAFVLRNAEGRSKRYGFVEYSLKSQALNAKMAMGNINMDGRVLRVEWSDCKKIADMFSTVLFVDRIPKENPNVEASLRSLFGKYGKVRDCHLAIGMSNQFRGFGFIDFYHSLCADKAHQALDGHELEGHSIRVSFANPTKSAQSYKTRFGSQSAPAPYGHGGRGSFPGMMGNAPVRGHMPMATPGQRFMGPGRTGMMGIGIGMQFGRGSHGGQALHDQGLPGSGAGMLGTGASPAGMMGRPPLMNSVAPRRGMTAGATLAPIPRLPGQGHSSINPAAIAQVATAQAKAREAKAREEYYQLQPQHTVDNAFKQGDSQYGYQQPYQQQTQQQQTVLQAQYQQQVGQNAQQPYTQYYSQPAQGYIQSQAQAQAQQQPQHGPYPQSATYYQQQPTQPEQAIQPQPYAYGQPYAQQYGQQYGASAQQQYGQPYNQPTSQIGNQQYQQAAQPQVQTQYSQPYNQPAPQSNAPQFQQMNAVAPSPNAAGILTAQTHDGTPQQAYTAYYNQQQQQQQNVAQVASGAAQTSNVVPTSQQSLEAQWAAYYASQAAYQQQTASYPQQQQQQQPPVASSFNEPLVTQEVGQKRTADQMDAGSQSQTTYNYQQTMLASYPQQVPTGAGPYQQNQAMPATAYQQHSTVPNSGYQMQTNAQPYQHQPTATGYQQPVPATVSTGYDKPVVPVGDGYQQQQPVAAAAVFQPAVQGQAVNAPVYDYNKRP
ncbi:hypothetical protein KI387_016998, partial [Taxus chinensis]